MLRELRWDGAGVTVASFAYALSPYLLEYAARISVILLPVRRAPVADRPGRPRTAPAGTGATPAVFALVTLTVGGVNATSLILVMFGPLLWFLHATFVAREVTFGQATRDGAADHASSPPCTSLWWVAGLMIQGAYGIPILRYTETYETVAAAATRSRGAAGARLLVLLRHRRPGRVDRVRRSATSSRSRRSRSRTSSPVWRLAGGLAHPVAAPGLLRVDHRGRPRALGRCPPMGEPRRRTGAVFRAWTRGDLGLSFRSTPRAAPLVILGLAVFLGAGVAALSTVAAARCTCPVTGGLLVLICANQLPLFQGQLVDRNLVRDEERARVLDRGGRRAGRRGDRRDTRVYEVPGIDFAAYRWGNTVDPITPGLTDRRVRRPRAHPLRLPRLRRAALPGRGAVPVRPARARRARTAGPAHGGRSDRVPGRHPVRALPHARARAAPWPS